MKNKFLIVIIILIVLIVGGLGYYTYFLWNKEAVVSKVDLSDTEALTILDSFPYQMLVKNSDVEVKDLSAEQVIYIGYDGLIENQIILGDSSTCDSTSSEVLVKCIAKSLNLTDEQINKINTSIWENSLGGSTQYEMVSPEIVSTIIENKLGLTNQFAESFYKNIGFSCGSKGFIYDKEINMLFSHEEGGCALGLNYVININSGYKENDIYKINFTEGVFDPTEPTDEKPITFDLYSRSNTTTILESGISNNKSEDEMKALVDKYKSSLDNYEITFKKVGNNYQFVSLEYIK